MAESIPVEPYNAQATRRQGQGQPDDISVAAQPGWIDRARQESSQLTDEGASTGARSVGMSGIGSKLASGGSEVANSPDEIVRDFQAAKQQARTERQTKNPGSSENAASEIKDSSQAAVAVVSAQGLKYLDLAVSQFWVGFSIFSVAAAVSLIGVILTLFAAVAVASGTILSTFIYLYNGRRLNLVIALLPPRIGISSPTEIEGSANLAVIVIGAVTGLVFVLAVIGVLIAIINEYSDILSVAGV